ncbi:hypothetical protein HYN48_07230 [Flavobacterium magnum]|uniref:Bacterial Ig-like domain-containing protein n=2 Tax=Flavobacterium magnum TaxID=2162713 RepID=A0A2S0RE39_9FLAO|nr:hypothetical protein HYN48_07230 [Flavobacterium magnum]
MGISIDAMGQTLQPGDIVVIGIGADTGNPAPNTKTEFSWVPLVNLNAGTQFYFTDAGWNTLSNEFMATGLTDEILLRYTVPSGGILAGTVQTVSEAGTSADYTVLSGTKCGSDTDGKLSLPNAGDEIIVFRSTATVDANFPGTNFTAIFACTSSTTDWNSLNTNTASTAAAFKDNYSNLPPGLTNGTNAVAVGIGPGVSDEADNARYEGNTSGSRAVLLSRVCTLSNWKRYDVGGDLPDFSGTTPVLGWTANGVSNFSVSGADITPPVVQSIALTAAGANSASVTYTITFNETANNVSADDFQLTVTGTGVTGVIGTPSSSSGTSMTIAVSNITGTGTLRLDLKSNTNITDATGNGFNTNGYVAAFTSGGVQTVDRDAPSLSITSSAAASTNLNPIPITFTFSESVTGFDASDVVVTGGSIGSVSGSGNLYTANLTPSADGTVTVNVAAAKATDGAGNGNTAAAQLSRVSDRTAPTITSMNYSVGSPTNSSSFTLTINFSESVTGFATTDISMTNASLSNLAGSGSSYTVTVTPTADGTITANIPANGVFDAALNGNTAASPASVTVDRAQPTVSISSPQGNPTNASPITVSFTFNESVSNFVNGDISVTNGSLSGFTGSGTSYSVFVSPTADGPVTVSLSSGVANDSAGNGNVASSVFSITSDRTGPTVSISSGTASITNASSIPVTVTFNESVTGFVQTDLSLGNGSVNSFSGSGTTYTFNVVPTSNGTVTINIAAGVATDAAGNGNSVASQFSRTYDNVPPAFQTPGPPPGITNTSPYVENITLTESVADFTSADIQVTNGTVTNFSGSGTSYAVTIAPTSNGTVVVSVPAGAFHDAAGNANTATLSRNTLYDNVQPTVSITSGASNPTNANIPVTVTFSESVSNFVQGDVTVGNGSVTSFSGSGTTYTFTVVPSSNGTVTVDVAAGVATDQASNLNTAAAQLSRVFDNVQPSVNLSSSTPSPTNSNNISVTVTFSESVSNFIAADVAISNGSVNSFSGSGTTYTFNIVPASNGTVTAGISSGVANDAAGNTNTAATPLTWIYDNVQPTVAITAPGTPNPTSANNFQITVTFSESVAGFTSGEIVVGNGVLSNFSGSGTTYTATVTPTADGTVTVNVSGGVANDTAGNTNTAAGQYSVVSDRNGPGITISSSATNPSNLATIPLTFTFTEPVTGFTFSDIFTSGGTLSAFSGSGTTYTANLSPAVDGTINVFVFAGVANDSAGNGNSVGTFAITSDRTRPTVSITSAQSTPTSANPIVININFSESVVNFVQSDITATGGTLSNFSGSGSSYSVNLTPSGNGNKTVNVAANVATDAAGNNNFAASQFSIFYVTACSQPTVWNGLFWSNGNPVPTQPAVINGDYVSADVNPGGFSACSLIVGTGFNAVISPGDNLTITGNVTVQAGATLTFENNANLIQSGSVTTGNSGNITIKRNATMVRQDYVYWSSPVTGQNLLAFSPATLPTRFYEISETTNAFVYVNPATNTFQAAKGYAIRAPDNYTPNVPTAFQGVFTGVPRKGDISIPVTHNNQGYNLIGNPYPSPINADAFLAANPNIGTIYFWAHLQQSAPSGANYASYNATGAAAASNTVPVSPLPNGTIQTGQGFMALADAPGTAVFTNSMRVNNTDDQFYRTAADGQRSRIWLNLSSSLGSVNQMLVGYVPEATDNFDLRFDGKLAELQGTKLYSLINGSEYVIQGRALPFADTDVVPLGFKTDADGTYKISLDHTDGLFDDSQDVFLKDNLTGTVHNIKLADYAFAATAGTYHNRFEIVYQNSPLSSDAPLLETDRVVLFREQGVLNIDAGNVLIDHVKVFDTRGRMIYEKHQVNADAVALTDLNAAQEVLLVQITAADGRTITKKAIN